MWDKQSIIDDNKRNLIVFPVNEDSPLVSVIVVNHNGEEHLKRLFSSFVNARFYQKYEIVVVEQVSTDGSLSLLEKYQDILPIKVLKNYSNESFSLASNKGADASRGDYLLFLNNDTEVTDGWMDALLDTAVRENTGAVGARLVYPEIPEDSVNAGRSWTIQHKGVLWECSREREGGQYTPYHQGRGNCPIENDSFPVRYGVVTAACLLVKKTIFNEVGGFDENYQWGYEDVDLCLKIYRHGYDNYCVYGSLLFHYEFGTQNRDGKKVIDERRAGNCNYLNARWGGWLEKSILRDKLEHTKLFSEVPLKICLVADSRNDSCKDAEELYRQMQMTGCLVTILDAEHDEVYESSKDADIIISLEPKFDPLEVRGGLPSLLTFAWCQDRMEEWFSSGGLEYFNYVLVENSAACDTVYDRTGRIGDVFSGRWQEILEILYRRFWQDEEKVMILSPAPNEEKGKTWGDHHFAKDLADAFKAHGYSTEVRTYDIWDLPFSGKYTVTIKGSVLPEPYHPKMEFINIMWNISHPEALSPRDYDEYDMNFVASRSYAKQLAKRVRTPVAPLMQCTSLRNFHPVKKGEHHELLFVGDALSRFRRIVKDLLPTDYDFAIYGRNWENYVPKEYIKGQYIDNKELKNYYANCDILLNDHWSEMRLKGFLSNRLFDGLAAGTLVITDAVEGLEKDLADGVIAYDGTKKDLRSKVEYWLKHNAKRLEKVTKGGKIVEEQHTFYHRVAVMMEFLKTAIYR